MSNDNIIPDWDLSVSPNLIFLISKYLNIHTSEVLSVLDSIIHTAVSCPPNLTRRPFQPKTADPNDAKVDLPIWIIRGFFPETPIFFKMVIADLEKYAMDRQFKYRVKIQLPHNFYNGIVRVNTKKIREDAAEKEILGDFASKELEIKKPRCMTPKGMKPLRMRLKKVEK